MGFLWWFMVTVHWQSQDFVWGQNYGNNILVKTNLHTHAYTQIHINLNNLILE